MREETCCCHMGYSFRLAARVLLYAPSHRQDSTYHGLCYTSRGALAGTRNSSMGRSDDPLHHERTLLPRSYISLLCAREMFALIYLCVQVVSSSGVTVPDLNISYPACAIIAPLSIQNLESVMFIFNYLMTHSTHCYYHNGYIGITYMVTKKL